MKNIVLALTIFAFLMPSPVQADVGGMANCQHNMSVDVESDVPCHDDLNQTDDTDCGEDCAFQCTTVTSSIVTPLIFLSHLRIDGYLVDADYSQVFQSVFPESIHHPPISIS